MGEFLTVTMTDHRPIKIKKDNWHIIAENVEHSEDGSDTWEIKVRESLDRIQYIIQGIYSCNHPEFPSEERHGFLVDDIDKVPQAIKNIQNLIKATPKLAHVCISRLPALRLDG